MTYKNKYYDASKSHHTVKGFCNPEPFTISYKDIQKWKRERKVVAPEGGYENFKSQWYQTADFSALSEGVWWLGHATSLIKINSKTIITDPVFSERASPLSFAGPKRYTPCACSVEQLPRIDIIVISHNHYDHLDYASIRQLIKRFPLVSILVPLGLKQKLQSWGATQVVELDWWESSCVDGVILSAIPAEHWSRRTLFDTNRSLWCGWMIEYAKRTIYLMGDTGYSTQFAKVKRRFPNIDLALIPIGSYAPRWFMQNQHIDPAQAVQLFHDIGCKKAIAIHWGAFELADDSLSDPPKELKAQLVENNVTDEQFQLLKIGQHIAI